jgi:hypothetical protein
MQYIEYIRGEIIEIMDAGGVSLYAVIGAKKG